MKDKKKAHMVIDISSTDIHNKPVLNEMHKEKTKFTADKVPGGISCSPA